ncbi:pre-mRNA splicing factor syf2 [Microthyrium microscopicum]|uniref:Pre-mRNA-splicing factor SYF2 n=1 Tax=Microthyrium microscopicum TaxID=703497 RepID=A0A6A6URB0_9PEZI|nr:pre-mRNA splicing factor syf2 [Microthyrium microscopicum]
MSSKKRAQTAEPSETPAEPSAPETTTNEPTQENNEESSAPATTESASDRLARFKALKARHNSSKKENLQESQHEAQRMATNPNLLNALNRKHAIASHKLLKAETTADGDDFERKRAWDWTAEESEKWDKRVNKKGRHKEDVAFQDYTQDSRKVYKRQMRDFKVDLEAYQKGKMEAIEKAVEMGGLDIVETEDGELIAVDRDGSFYSTADTSNMQKKPDKEAIDRLVNDLEKAEAQRLKKRRERLKKDDDGGDVTYINIKNKQFNEKLKRFYDKYTSDIRDSFERGTAV